MRQAHRALATLTMTSILLATLTAGSTAAPRNTSRQHPPTLHRRHGPPIRYAPPLLGPVIASWYWDAGTTGCGFHAHFGIATLLPNVPCGGQVRICNGSLCVIATRDDSGPYVAGRVFDLDPATKAAIDCSDLCSVRYTLLTGPT